MNKNKKMFLITITFLMLLGLTTITATNIDTNDTTSTQTNTIDTTTQTNTINYDSTSTNEESTTPTDNIQKTTNSKETINNKTRSKTQNLKADTIVTSTYAELNGNLTSNAQDIVTIDIGDDIELEGNIVVNEAIKTLTINGNQKIINGMGQYRFLLIRNATTVIIDNIIITNCTTTANGGAIAGQKDSIITLQNSILTYNKASHGGAVHTDQGNIIITNTTLAYNNASVRGGAIHNNQGNLTVNNSILTHNNANNLGGAIHSNKYLTIDYSNLTNNNATEGGAISLYGGNAITINTNITHNQASIQGGAIFNGNTDLRIINSNLKYNNATGGGAIHKNRGTTTIIGTNITHNLALIYGGAINNTRGILTIINSSLNYNNATGGGAINNNGNITITNTNLNNNKVPQSSDSSRGGAILSDQGNIKIDSSNLTNNYAEYNGGAIYFGHGILTIDSSNLTNNAARIHGGAVYNGYANLIINNTSLTYNNVGATGGAIHNNYGNVTLNDNTMEYNVATQGGAILSNCGDVTINNNTMNYNTATQGGVIHNKETNLTISDSIFNNNSANTTGAVIYSNTTNTFIVLKDSNITDNYVTSNNGYVVDFSNTNSVTITGNTFINNTDNTRDMLFSNPKDGAQVDIHGNTYIDNFLEDTIIAPNVTKVTDNESRVYDYYVDVDLRSVYNDTVRNGTLNVYVNGVLNDIINMTGDRERIFFQNSVLTNRENNITLEYITQSKHYQNTTSVVTVKKEINTTLSIQAPSNMTAGDTALINFTLVDVNNNSLSGETIHVLINEEEVAILTTEDGVASYTFQALGDDIVTIVAKHPTSNDSIYLSASDKDAEINVVKIQPEIVIVPGNLTPHVESSINISLFEPNGTPIKNKTVIVNITEEGKPDITGTVTTDENGTAVFNFTPTDEGTINITVTSPGDDIYHYESETVQAIKNFITTNLLVTASNTTINQTNTITVEVLGGLLLSGTVELDINGEIHKLNITNGFGTYKDYKSDTAGEKNVTAKFTSDNPSYANSTRTSEFKVDKLPTRVTIEAINRTAGNVTLKVLVFPKDDIESIVDGGNIVIESVNGENRTVIYNNTLKDGELIYLTDVNETGWYEFETTYYGNDYFYGEINNTGSLEVLPVNTNTTTFDKSALVGDTITLNATVTDENGNPVNDGNVTFLIDGKQLYDENGNPVEAVVDNGIATTEYILPVTYIKGNYTITANYTGNNRYNTSSGVANLQIDPKETSISGTPLNTTKANTTIEVTLNTTDDNKPIPNAEIIIKDENGNTIGEGFTDENGTAIITLDLPVGENNIIITYPGNEIYAPQEEPMTINVTRRESKTTGTIANNTAGNVTVDVVVVDAQTSEPITGQVNLIVADEIVGTGNLSDDGRASIPADIDVKGNYTIIVEYMENDDYYGSSDTLDDVTVVGKEADMNVTAQNTTLNVTLKDNETAKPLPDAHIIVTLPDGTTVNGTTDENGTAIIPVDLEPGVNNLTVTYPGDDEYDSQEENITIIIKSYSTVTVDPVIGTVFDNVTFTANVVDYQGNNVNGGYVIFKVGGKTLTNENGNIKTYVVNGTAQLSYKAENEWIIDSHPNLKVEAVYSGTSIVSANRSDTSKVTIYKRNATVMVTAPDDYVNGTLHIDAVVRDQNGSLINDGILVFKINGLTLKDENNKGIIAKVTNGTVHLDVKLPFAYSAKEYNLTAVYSNKIYNKATGTNTTTLKAIPTYVNATVTIKDEYSKPVVTGQIYNKFNNAILEGTAVINIKFDGISYAKKVKVNNGTFNETLEGIPIYKPGTHKVEVVSGDTYHYQGVRKTYTTKATKKYDVNTEFINITRNKTTTRVQARMVDNKNNNVQRNITITIKLNGKSFLVNKKITNGNVDVLIDTSKLSNRNYTLELVSGANTYYKASKTTTELSKY